MLQAAAVLLATTFAIPHPSQHDYAAYDRSAPRLASDGESSLVVWQDDRPDASIRGAIVSPEGWSSADFAIARPDVLDWSSSPLIYGREALDVASNGDGYLVAYSEVDIATSVTTTRFARVSRYGEVEPGEGRIAGELRSMAAYDDWYVVVILPGRARPAQLAVVDEHGNVLREGRPVAAEGRPLDAMVFAIGRRLLIAWPSPTAFAVDVGYATDLYGHWTGARATASLGPARLPISIARNDGGTLAAWMQNQKVYTAILDAGAKLVHGPRVIADPPFAQGVAAAPLGEQYVVFVNGVISSTGFATRAMPVDAEGREVEGAGRSVAPSAYSMTAGAGADGAALLIRTDFPSTSTDMQVFAHRIRPDGGRNSSVLSFAYPSQTDGAVASCRGITTIAWIERNGFINNAKVRRFTDDGNPLGEAVSLGSPYGSVNDDVSVTCGKRSTLVAWNERGLGIRFERFHHGVLLRDDGTMVPFDEPLAAGTGTVTFSNGSYLVFAGDYDQPTQWTRWSEEGTWLAQRALPSIPRADVTALAPSGDTLLAVWSDVVSAEDGYIIRNLVAQRFDANANPIGPRVELVRAIRGAYYGRVAAAASPHGWLVAWHTDDGRQFTARLAADGTLLDPIGGVVTGKPAEQLKAWWNGNRYEVLEARGIVTRTPDGRITLWSLLGKAIDAMTSTGDERIVVHRR
ncbi:MAG: hypothetical protein ACLGH0_03790, partial [Thermoanaerobaculia bacterium]